MPYDDYRCLRVERDAGIARVALDHPPINLFDAPLLGEVARLGAELEADDDVRVVVLRSANPEFFIAHADVSLIQKIPVPAPPRGDELSFFHAMVERWRTLPKATIGVVEGRVRQRSTMA